MAPEALCGELELPRHPSAAKQARAYVEERFAGHLASAATYDLSLVVSELVSNAVVHGRGAITLRAHEVEDGVRVEVIDEGAERSDEICAQAHSETAEGGRGLQIVEALSRDWGAHEGTTHVWAEIAAA